MKKMNLKKGLAHRSTTEGFTLIELLVVVAIIGILASVVLASLNTARAKGANAAIKANLANIRAQAELVYDQTSPNGYGLNANTAGACPAATAGSLFANTVITNAINAALTASGGTSLCASTTSAWVASVQLKVAEGTNTHWCVDSTGVSTAKGTIADGTDC
ncbi:MAG: type IV pilus assembly protein PilA [Parcubacteria group bacterium Gr01-1014_24]|nr:MAG: type IV pilus assembly protein PilA [Parcubacteria group bacterium Gr01-1014_24]